MEKNDKDPDLHHADDHNDKSKEEEKADIVSDAPPPVDVHHEDGVNKENVDVGNAESDHNQGDNADKVNSPLGQEEAPTPEIPQTIESLSEELDQLLTSLSLHKEENKDNTEEEKGGEDGYFQIPQFVGKFLDLFEDKLSKHDSAGDSKTTTWYQDPEEVSSLLEAVDRVSKLMELLLNTKSCLDHHESLINHAGSIQQRAMAFLEDEFRLLLEESVIKEPVVVTEDNNSSQQDHHSDSQDQDQDQVNVPEDGDKEIEYPGYSEEVVVLLRKIVEKMKGAGYGCECREAYLIGRRNILMRTLKQECEFEKVSIDEVQKMSWGELEREIPIWNKTVKNCASLFFPGELKLAEKIFPEDKGSLFCLITHGLAIQFLGFAEAVAMTKRSTEKLFKILDIYETLRDSFPAMEELFPEELRGELRSEVTTARSRLGESAINIFSDLENSIKSDSSKTPVPGGAVHPLTRYTMNYLKYSCEYKDTLEQVFKSHSKMEEEEEESNTERAFANQLMRIMDSLDGNMEAKSKLYKDVPLSCIFMMNNGRYIVQKIKGSAEIHEVMGDTWCRKRSSELRTYHKNYQRETWGKLLGFLGHEGLMHNNKIVKPNLKERFKSFNATFDEIHKTQTTWVVNDEQLQSELRVSITAVMIPAYRAFMARFGQYLDPGRQTEKYVKYQPEDIEDLIDQLFEGNTSSSSTATAKRRT
ncbi:Exocyst subunit Exo70 family protein [Hirschfeldia incana]|nr:Exocyst subunit Exo70 family protein [Hirschfeldia incana]